MVGYAFMGAAHSQAWRTADRFFDLPLRPDMAVLCGRDAAAVAAAARPAGLAVGGDRLEAAADARRRRRSSTSARRATPTPRSRSPRWTRASTCCARSPWPTRSPRPRPWSPRPSGPGPRACAAWSASTTGGCPRWRWPAARGRRAGSAQIRHVRAQYLQDWIVDPEFPLVWRLQAEKAGSGALGDIGAHIVDMAQFVIGDRLAGVSALTETFVKERPLPAAASGLSAAGGTERGPVTVDDAALFLGRFARRGAGELRGHPVRHRPQERDPAGGQRQRRVAGVRLRVDERAVVLRRRRGPADRGLPAHPGHRADPSLRAAPGGRPDTCLGYEHSFTHEVVDLITDLAADRDPTPVVRRRAAGAAGAGRGRASSAARGQRLAAHRGGIAHGTTDHPVHRPVGRPAVRGGGPARRRSGATTGWRSPAGATTSTRGPPSRTTPTSPGRREILAKHGLEVYAISNHLTGQAVCDDPIDERHRAILPARVWGDGEPEGVRQRAADGHAGDRTGRGRSSA